MVCEKAEYSPNYYYRPKGNHSELYFQGLNALRSNTYLMTMLQIYIKNNKRRIITALITKNSQFSTKKQEKIVLIKVFSTKQYDVRF